MLLLTIYATLLFCPITIEVGADVGRAVFRSLSEDAAGTLGATLATAAAAVILFAAMV